MKRQDILNRLEGKKQRIDIVRLGMVALYQPGVTYPFRLMRICGGRYVETPSKKGSHTYWKLMECFGRVVTTRGYPSKKWRMEINKEAQERWPGIPSDLS